MSIHEYLDKIKSLQSSILNYIDHDYNIEENYQNILRLIEDQKIQNNRQDLQLLLYLLDRIANDHFRYPRFFEKIEKIIRIFKKDIQQLFTNYEIFNIFKKNKRILLFLLQEKMLFFDEKIVKIISDREYTETKYSEYFSPELKIYFDLNKEKNKHQSLTILSEIPEDFDKKRKEGNNDSKICKLIQNDSIDEFISYVNQTNYSLQSKIEISIYETNNFLIKKFETSNYDIFRYKNNLGFNLIEYASFFGSLQIIKYLVSYGVKLYARLWDFAIHSDNPELFSFLEENNILPKVYHWDQLLFEKCLFSLSIFSAYKKSNYKILFFLIDF